MLPLVRVIIFLLYAFRRLQILTGFRLAIIEVWEGVCEVPYLRSISPNFPDGFSAFLIFYASAYTALQGGLVLWYLPVPLYLMRRRYYGFTWKRNPAELRSISSEEARERENNNKQQRTVSD